MATVSMTYARENFAEVCERAHFHNETILVKKGKHEHVVIIPFKDEELLEQIERVIGSFLSDRALENYRAGAPTYTPEEVWQMIGRKKEEPSTITTSASE